MVLATTLGGAGIPRRVQSDFSYLKRFPVVRFGLQARM
jgi:hypothetical protein